MVTTEVKSLLITAMDKIPHMDSLCRCLSNAALSPTLESDADCLASVVEEVRSDLAEMKQELNWILQCLNERTGCP